LDVRRWAFDVFFINLDSASARFFRRSLLAWYRENRRDLPWRQTTDPYAIFVSEFMLQQTQVATVVPYYNEWLRRFPDVTTLAAASESDVLHAWQGLGYYSRARNLRAAARSIVKQHAGRFPRSPESIRELSGVGRYTANATATFAFNQSLPIVESNIARVLARLFDLQIPIDTNAGREQLWTHATELLPKRNAGEQNAALMELGALVCRVRPNCAVCPVKRFCRTTDPGSLPRKKPRSTLQLRTETHSFAMRRSRVLLEQATDRWRGMWILPRLTDPPARGNHIHRSAFPFTHHQITLTVHPGARRVEKKRGLRWFAISDLASIPIPSPHRRALNDILAARLAS
jgi:A/G-specific adenine glycosylase